MENIIQLIKDRKSVRTFSGEPISEEDMEKIRQSLAGLTNPFGVKATYEIIDAKAVGAGSAVIVGTNMYVGIKVPREPGFELACGYEFEKFCLEAESFGIGTVMLAATIKRAPFERAMQVGPNEVMPVVTPIGYPAEKRSMREILMRKGIRADDRLPFEKLFFDKAFGTPLTPEKAGPFQTALEMMRLAPSATNKQPWRAVVDGQKAYIYEKRSFPVQALGDIQMLDVGNGICNFLLTLESEGCRGTLTDDNPNLPSDDSSMIYVRTYTLEA